MKFLIGLLLAAAVRAVFGPAARRAGNRHMAERQRVLASMYARRPMSTNEFIQACHVDVNRVSRVVANCVRRHVAFGAGVDSDLIRPDDAFDGNLELLMDWPEFGPDRLPGCGIEVSLGIVLPDVELESIRAINPICKGTVRDYFYEFLVVVNRCAEHGESMPGKGSPLYWVCSPLFNALNRLSSDELRTLVTRLILKTARGFPKIPELEKYCFLLETGGALSAADTKYLRDLHESCENKEIEIRELGGTEPEQDEWFRAARYLEALSAAFGKLDIAAVDSLLYQLGQAFDDEDLFWEAATREAQQLAAIRRRVAARSHKRQRIGITHRPAVL